MNPSHHVDRLDDGDEAAAVLDRSDVDAPSPQLLPDELEARLGEDARLRKPVDDDRHRDDDRFRHDDQPQGQGRVEDHVGGEADEDEQPADEHLKALHQVRGCIDRDVELRFVGGGGFHDGTFPERAVGILTEKSRCNYYTIN